MQLEGTGYAKRPPRSSAAGWRARVPWVLSCLLVGAAQLWLAARLPLFGDEAFYWLESRHLAWGYSDVPSATPWMIALGTALAGNTSFGVRWPFLALTAGSWLLVWAWARRFVPADAALRAVGIGLLLPLAASLGIVALPDVPLTFSILLGMVAAARALRHGRWVDYLAWGGALALGWLSHYRFAMVYAAGLWFLLGAPRGRQQWRQPRFWAAQLLGLVGLLPLVWFNGTHHWGGFRFQFLDRHPWSFHADAVLEVLVQAACTTPLLFVALVGAAHVAWRRRKEPPYDLLFAFSAGLWLLWWGFAFWADRERVHFHWMLPAYLLLLPLVPGVLDAWQASAHRVARLCARASLPVAAIGTLAWFAWLAGPLLPPPARIGGERAAVDNLHEWQAFANWVKPLVARDPQAILIGNHFMVAAQAAYALRGERPVYALDHPLNAKHGRALQLQVMHIDESALRPQAVERGLLLFEETAVREWQRVPAYLALCEEWRHVQVLDELDVFHGRKRFVAFAVSSRESLGQPRCQLPPMADFINLLPDARISRGKLEIQGWAIQDFTGIAAVEIWVDGRRVADAHYGTAQPRVRAQWPMSRDPNHPGVGFVASVDASRWQPGRHEVALHVRGVDGQRRILAQRSFTLLP